VRNWSLNILDDTSSPLRELLDIAILQDIVRREDANANIPWFGQLMSHPQLCAYLIQIETWLRTYKAELV